MVNDHQPPAKLLHELKLSSETCAETHPHLYIMDWHGGSIFIGVDGTFTGAVEIRCNIQESYAKVITNAEKHGYDLSKWIVLQTFTKGHTWKAEHLNPCVLAVIVRVDGPYVVNVDIST